MIVIFVQGITVFGDILRDLHLVRCLLHHQSCSCRCLRQLQGPGTQISSGKLNSGAKSSLIVIRFLLLLQLANLMVEAESARQEVLSAAFDLLDEQVQKASASDFCIFFAISSKCLFFVDLCRKEGTWISINVRSCSRSSTLTGTFSKF